MMDIIPAMGVSLDENLRGLVEIYKDFHRNPELSMREYRTAERISELLRGYGYNPFVCGGTGVVAVMSNGPGPTLAYRADIDGLPVAEETGVEFASKARGILEDESTETPVMHACGHDVHIVVALEIARLLSEHRDGWSGTVVFIFQPGEETAAGAQAMVADGLWEKAPKAEAIFGQHVWPGLAGTVRVSSGVAMSTADSLRVTVYGRQGHGSQPDAAIDPIVLGSYIVVRLQGIVARELGAQEAAVVTVGTFHGGIKDNIIPDVAHLTVNVRTFDPGVRDRVLSAIERIVRAEASASAAPAPDIETLHSFPECFNDPELVEDVCQWIGACLGNEMVTVAPPVMASEDFGVLGGSLGVPSVFWMLGGFSEAAMARDPLPVNHSPNFLPDDVEAVLRTGVLAGLAVLLSRLDPSLGA